MGWMSNARIPRVCQGIVVAIGCIVGHGRAQEPVQPPFGSSPDSVLAAAIARLPGTPLDLEAAVNSALAEATAIREAEAGLRAAHGSLRREKGEFDPELFGSYETSGAEAPAATPFAGAAVLETERQATTAGARIRWRTGTEIEAVVDTRRLETNSIFAALNPEYSADGRIELTQPLLKGFGPAARASLTSAERELDAAESRYESTVLAVRAAVEQLFWDLYAAERDLAVERLIRDRAAQLVEETRLRNRIGVTGPDDVANSEVFLAQEDQAVLDREEQLGAISDRLATLIGQRPQPGLSTFRPQQEPPLEFPVAPVDSVVALALVHNHDLQVVQNRIAALRSLERGSSWDALPELDLVGSLGGNGLAGTPQDVIFGSDTLRTSVSGSAGDTWSQVFGRDFPTWSLGLRLTLPLGLREGRGERDRLRAEVQLAESQLLAVQRELEENVRNRQRELDNAAPRVAAARRGVVAAIEQTRIGVLEYQNGRKTAFEVVRLADDVATAQQRYSQALVRAAKSAAALRLLTAGHFPPRSSP